MVMSSDSSGLNGVGTRGENLSAGYPRPLPIIVRKKEAQCNPWTRILRKLCSKIISYFSFEIPRPGTSLGPH
jgi:hypothetical protein